MGRFAQHGGVFSVNTSCSQERVMTDDHVWRAKRVEVD